MEVGIESDWGHGSGFGKEFEIRISIGVRDQLGVRLKIWVR